MTAKYAYDKLSGRITQADTTVNTKVGVFVARVRFMEQPMLLCSLIKEHYE